MTHWGERLILGLQRCSAASPVLARLSLGAIFLQSGWGKVNHLERTTSFFADLGIVAPGFHAVLVGNVEFFGGIALVFGLGTRLVSAPLGVTMVVALVTSAIADVEGLLDFLALNEFLYLSVLLWLLLAGPGKWSVDHLIKTRLLSST